MNRSFLCVSLLSLFLSILLASCSGGETGTGVTGSDPKVSVGAITGFGSVFVNGIKYDTTDAEINVNESVATEQDLSIGMVVAVVGSTTQGDVGKADAIYYESEVCGIVTQINLDGTLNIMGQMVKYDNETEFESTEGTVATIDAIPEGAVVEVSGYRTGDNTLFATRLKLVSKIYVEGTELTVKGVVTAGLSNGKFSMGTLTVVVDSSTQFIDITNQQVTPGMMVKVKSIRGMLNNELQADNIEPGNNDYVAAGTVMEIEGIVMNLVVESNEFLLNGYTVYFSDQTEFDGGTASDLADGMKAEVEGVLLSQNQIEAKEISFRKTARLELIARVTSKNTAEKQVDMAGITVHLTNKTLLKDDDKKTKVRRFSLEDLDINDKVKIKAYQDNLSQEIIATQFRRVEAGSMDSSFELSGVLDELNNDQVIVSGIPVDRSQITELSSEVVGSTVTVRGITPLTIQQ